MYRCIHNPEWMCPELLTAGTWVNGGGKHAKARCPPLQNGCDNRTHFISGQL